MSSKSVRPIYWIASFALAGLLLYFAVRGLDVKQTWATLKGVSLSQFALCYLISSCNIFLRSFRWRVLLRPEGRVSVINAFWATSLGYLGNTILPARAGEVVRTMVISVESKLSRTFVLTTALAERLADAITLVAIVAVVLLILPQPPGWLAHAAKPAGIIAIGGLISLLLLPVLENFLISILERITMTAQLREKLVYTLSQILQGLRTFHNPPKAIRFTALTAVIWSTDALIARMVGHAVGLDLSVIAVLLLLAGLGLGSALPSTPGYIGIYQFAAISILVPLGVAQSQAMAFIILFQALQLSVCAVLGLIALLYYRNLKIIGKR